jgi:hypothetical protein
MLSSTLKGDDNGEEERRKVARWQVSEIAEVAKACRESQ